MAREPLSGLTPGMTGGSPALASAASPMPPAGGDEEVVEARAQGPRLTPFDETDQGGGLEENERLIELFREEWDKPFWKNLAEQTAIDVAYYTGSGQWDPVAAAQNAASGKPALTLNHIKPTCETLFGLERMNRMQPVAAPEGEADRETAAVFTRLIRRTMYDADGEYLLSDAFEDGVISGVAMLALPLRMVEDPAQPTIDIEVLRVPDEVIWTTPWRRYDLDDVRAMFRHKWVHVDDLVALYPDKRQMILDAVNAAGLLAVQDQSPQGARLRDGDPRDRYAGDTARRGEEDRGFWFDEQHQACRVLECYFPRYSKVWIVATEDGRHVLTTAIEDRAAAFYRRIAKDVPELGIKVFSRVAREIYMKVILPMSGETLDEGSPFERDKNSYPYVPYFAHLKRDEVFGVVRSLRDSQDEINARRSQIAWLLRATGDGWFVDQGSMVNITQFERESRDPKGVYEILTGKPDPRRVPGPSVPQNLFELVRWSQQEIKLISAVNSELTGSGAEDRSLSGVAMKRRQEQGIVATSSLFDNFKRTKRLFFRKMARRIQETYTGKRVVRLLNEETHEEEFVPINQPQALKDGQPLPDDEAADLVEKVQIPGSDPPPGVIVRVLNDMSTLKYDIVMVEEPASPTARTAALATLLELLQKVPAVAPMLIEAIVEMTEGLPNRDRILRRVKAWSKQMFDAPQGPPPPKVNVSLKGDISPQAAQDLLDDGMLNASQPAVNQGAGTGGQGGGGPMGAANGNAANPNGQLPTGGTPNELRADLPAR